MNNQNSSPSETDLDNGKALRFVRSVRRCLPDAHIHWVEAEHPRCQCGKIERRPRPDGGMDTAVFAYSSTGENGHTGGGARDSIESNGIKPGMTWLSALELFLLLFCVLSRTPGANEIMNTATSAAIVMSSRISIAGLVHSKSQLYKLNSLWPRVSPGLPGT